MMEFHISRNARDQYHVDDALFSLRGNVIFANLNAARLLAQALNASRDLDQNPDRAVQAGDLYAMGLLDEILHFVTASFRTEANPNVFQEALTWLEDEIGEENLDSTLRKFVQDFPSSPVYRDEITLDEFWGGKTDSMPNRQVVLEELLMLWLDNENPAFENCLELFDHSDLIQQTSYIPLLSSLYDFFETQPAFGPDRENLIDMLRRPALESPNSLSGQLNFIRQHWAPIVSELITQILSSLDFIREDQKAFFAGAPGPGPARVLEFQSEMFEPENFSPDLDWMPSLVLLAKNTYVWLDQLSKQYGQKISRLDQIPDEELDRLSRWGVSGLWLIGLWQRSQASRQVKQMRGNPEAVASAYSVYDYQIADDLGGEAGYISLRERAWQRGIRLSADMVPNHMGIDSRWVIEHPDWFISLDQSPFPTYTFNGPNLTNDERVGIYLEDHYYDNSDAAVVFKRLDHWTGVAKYIYHGNDGTSMPWNDTAQLNFLLPEVREAVIQTILHVARKFQVIRFDAAMTLSKKHFHRLWYPEPGSGGDIPSRAEYGLTREQFDAAMPVEFWREVVDRVADEAPDTLLLAEAFWLMEGYFVRTLGMHRVYNSAFMNMLRDEKNAEYRLVIKNTLEFDPEILKRYVNFMNNPDEDTAVEQFGKGDKYFGVCVLLATMPGLPMFGHGQIEGFSEKYGMEYQRAYWDEPVDRELVERHEREIFPLLRSRYQFADVGNFLLYDFYKADGSVNEDVYAYSNQFEHLKSLVIYNNRYSETAGWIRSSSAYAVKSGAQDGEKSLAQKHLAEGLGLAYDAKYFTIFKDFTTGLEYIRNNKELHERGLFIELHAYQYHVFVGFRQVEETDWGAYAKLADSLRGSGVPDLEEAFKEQVLEPLLTPFRELTHPTLYQWITKQRMLQDATAGPHYAAVEDEVGPKINRFLTQVKQLSKSSLDVTGPIDSIQQKLKTLLELPNKDLAWGFTKKQQNAVSTFLGFEANTTTLGTQFLSGSPRVWNVLLSWTYIHAIGDCLETDPITAGELSRTYMDEWLLQKQIRAAMLELEIDGVTASNLLNMLRILVTHHNWWQSPQSTGKREKSAPAPAEKPDLLHSLLDDEAVQAFIGMNRFEDVIWFNKEAFEELLWWLYLIAILNIQSAYDQAENDSEIQNLKIALQNAFVLTQRLVAAERVSEYQVEKLIKAFSKNKP